MWLIRPFDRDASAKEWRAGRVGGPPRDGLQPRGPFLSVPREPPPRRRIEAPGRVAGVRLSEGDGAVWHPASPRRCSQRWLVQRVASRCARQSEWRDAFPQVWPASLSAGQGLFQRGEERREFAEESQYRWHLDWL